MRWLYIMVIWLSVAAGVVGMVAFTHEAESAIVLGLVGGAFALLATAIILT